MVFGYALVGFLIFPFSLLVRFIEWVLAFFL